MSESAADSVIAHAKTLYKQLAVLPSYLAANVRASTASSGQTTVQVAATVAIADFTSKKKRRWVTTVSAATDASADQPLHITGRSFPKDIGETGTMSTSPSGKVLFSTRTSADSKRFVEVFVHGIFKSLEVTKIHGGFCPDDLINGVSWSADETKLVYVADRLAPEDDTKYIYAMDWGEGYPNLLKPTIYVLDLTAENGAMSVKPILLEMAAIHPVLLPEGDRVVFTGVKDDPLPFGLKFCNNRITAIHTVSTDGSNLVTVTKEGWNGRTPILSPDASILFYLSNKIGGPHNSCAELDRYNLETGTTETIVPIVKSSTNGANDFPGLFSDRLIKNCIVSTRDESVVLMQTSWRCQETIVAVNVKTGVIHPITPLLPGSRFSWWLLGISDEGWIVAHRSMLNQPSELVLGKFQDLAQMISDIEWDTATVPGRDPNVQVLHMQSKKPPKHAVTPSGLRPLILIPHGGPHGVISTSYALSATLFSII
eukprot:jgi/Hompol1/6948/HPOL_005129-RA